MLNIKCRKLGVCYLVIVMEEVVVGLFEKYGVIVYLKFDVFGVYVDEKKVCLLGLRICNGCLFYGLVLNVNMDLLLF